MAVPIQKIRELLTNIVAALGLFFTIDGTIKIFIDAPSIKPLPVFNDYISLMAYTGVISIAFSMPKTQLIKRELSATKPLIWATELICFAVYTILIHMLDMPSIPLALKITTALSMWLIVNLCVNTTISRKSRKRKMAFEANRITGLTSVILISVEALL